MTTSEQLQLRSGTQTQVIAMTPAQAEVVVDTTNNRACVGDGTTAGGWPAAKLADIGGGFLSKFRNGTMDVWQRGTAALTATTSGAYTADGWIVLAAGASVTAAQAGGRLLTKASLQVTGASLVTDLIVKQRVESLMAAAFCSQTVTVQAQVYNNTGGSITPKLTVNRPSAQDNYTSVTADVNAVSLQACASSAWSLVSYTFQASAASYNGLEIAFDFGNNFGSSAKSIQIAECDIRVTNGVPTGLNANPSAPELRPIAIEMLLSLRYFRTSYLSAVPGTSGAPGYFDFINPSSTTANGSAYSGLVRFDAPMRTMPSVTLYGYSGTSGTVSNSGGADLAANSGGAANISASGFSVQNNSGGTVTTGGQALFHYTASAEL